MQKRKMWTVATIHFVLSSICIAAPTFIPGYAINGPFSEMLYWNQAWLHFFYISESILQPQLVYSKIFMVHAGFITIIKFIAIPFWSLCFGWLFVKFTNWLNHFPVLGKKVF